MNLEKFQELAPKTLNDLTVKFPEGIKLAPSFILAIMESGRRANLGHMAMGMAGEILSEVMVADFKKDRSNMLEEATDAKWYIFCLATYKGIFLSTSKLKDHDITTPDLLLIPSCELRMNLCVGELVDVVKRDSCYGKAKYQGLEVTIEQYEILIYNALKAIDIYLEKSNLDPEEGYDRVIEKLHKVRYKDGYSDEAALNRDLEAEKKVIDGEA